MVRGSYVVNGVNIPTSAQIGPGLVIHTWNGVYLPACRIGYNAMFQHGVVVSYYCKEIGNHVYFGPGAKVIRPVRIGNRARIGANAVVVEDVPDDCTALGIPARTKANKRKNPNPTPSTQEHLVMSNPSYPDRTQIQNDQLEKLRSYCWGR